MAAPVEFIAPKPLRNRHVTSMPKVSEEMDPSGPTPLLYMRFIPEYPTRKHRKPPMSGIRGPGTTIFIYEERRVWLRETTGTLCIYEAAEYGCRNVSADWNASRWAVVLGMRRTVGTEPDDVDLGM